MSAHKSFTDLYINRPILAIVVSMVIVIAGLQSYSKLTVRQYPQNENAIVTITTAYIGADVVICRPRQKCPCWALRPQTRRSEPLI